MSITVRWLGHAAFKITAGDMVLYIDPWKLFEPTPDAAVILVSHSHYDHYSPEDIAKISTPETQLLAPADVIDQHGSGRPFPPGQTFDWDCLSVTAVAAYNLDKQFHPKENNWLGFVIDVADRRIYYAGDTDLIPEMHDLKNIDLALLPVGGTYTMDAEEAAEAVKIFHPQRALPYHFGDVVGSRLDAEVFFQNAPCDVELLRPGDSLSL